MKKLLLNMMIIAGAYTLGYLTKTFQQQIGCTNLEELIETTEKLKANVGKKLEELEDEQ